MSRWIDDVVLVCAEHQRWTPVPVGSAALDIKVTFVGEYLFLASLFSPNRLQKDDVLTS